MSFWEQEGVRFSCLGCGRCCRGEPGAVWLSPRDETGLARHMGVSPEVFRALYAVRRGDRWSLRERSNYDCILLSAGGGRCVAYAARPLQCRLFPFWPSLLESRPNWDRAARRCPGMGQGHLWSPGLIAALLERIPFQDL